MLILPSGELALPRSDLEVNASKPKVHLRREKAGGGRGAEPLQEHHLLTQVMCASQVEGVTAMDVVVEGLLYQVLGLVTC